MATVVMSLIVIWLFILVFNQSARIREIKWLLGNLEKQIKNMKEQLAGFGNAPVAGPPSEAPGSRDKSVPKDESVAVAANSDGSELMGESRIEFPGYAPVLGSAGAPPAADRPSRVKSPAALRDSARGFNWEDFLGAKLFAWIGGFSLFIAFAFLLKYSFDRNLISPAVRVALGFICGAGLVGAGIHLKRRTYEITAQTLCATGVVILYTSNFAANSAYHFFGDTLTFALMSGITAGAFVLAAGMNARVVAVLGMVGGFLAPPLLSTWQDQPFALFSYITFLNAGLFLVAFYRKWNFPAALGAAGTVLTLLWWSVEFFSKEKVFVAMAAYLWFCALYCAAFLCGKKIRRPDAWLAVSAAALPLATFLFTLLLISNRSVGMRPGVIFSYLLGADLCLLAMAWTEEKLRKIHLAAGACVFLILSLWIGIRMTPELLVWALAGTLGFALLHTAIPMIAAGRGRAAGASWQFHAFPLLALLLTLIPVLKGHGGRWLVWHFVLLFNGGILVLAAFTASARVVLGALAVTAAVMIGWLATAPAGVLDSSGMVVVIGAFGIFFSVIATLLLHRLRWRDPAMEEGKSRGIADLFEISSSDNLFFQVPVFSSVMPFVLLIIASGRSEISNPASIFGLGLLLTGIALWLARFLKAPLLLPIAMGCFFLLEGAVHLGHFNPGNGTVFLGFYLVAVAVFFGLPFLYRRDYLGTVVPWATAALSGPLHFFLIHDVIERIYPNRFMGLLPAVMAVPFFFGLANLVGRIPKDARKRDSILAWFGGSTLFFITLIFPVQFDRQWLTIGWALEGAALIWLFHKIPHPGLRGLGFILLLGTFLRLAMNPAILLGYPQSVYPIFNWYLYTYGIAIFCLMAGARLLAPPRNRILRFNAPPVLYALGTVLAFILMNIEIADLFSTGVSLKFQFSGDLARSMAYSIAWAMFALCLIIVGIRKQLRPVRFAAIGLVGVTLVKLFFFDLGQLDQLYRIGAFVGVAVVLIAASVLYQKWVVRKS
ncbi:MAG: DUF2339 domain-containing protein [Acidobacteria bacterium]|nr:DUF2339 domain-containing protein [Acidobacteriota bacterium]